MSLLFTATTYILKASDMPQPHYQRVSCVQLCVLRLSGRAVLVHRWDHSLKPQTGAKGNAVQELFTVHSCKMVISQQSEVFWGVGLMFSAEVLKYEIDSLGSCKGWRHWERSSIIVLRGIAIQLSLGQGSSLLRWSGDKERQQPCEHVKGGTQSSHPKLELADFGVIDKLMKRRRSTVRKQKRRMGLSIIKCLRTS